MLVRARRLAKRSRSGVALRRHAAISRPGSSESLPWQLTGDQRRALREITADMTRARRGCTGCSWATSGTGKTVVALFAMLLAVENDFQAALMAPTELLAEQHAATLDAAARAARHPAGAAARPAVGGGEGGSPAPARHRAGAALVVGTHALMQESVAFQRLGLVVIDEQHRFGVEQRAALIGKGAAPDVLLLTATPIPRSLALTLYGDLDVSTLRRAAARPRGPCAPRVRTGAAARAGLEFVREECGRGPPGLRGAAGDRGVGAGRPARGDDDGRRRCAARWPELPGRAGARPAQGRGAGRRDAAVPRGRAARAGRHHGDRGRHRRAQRDDHADRAPGALRAGAAPPAARPGRRGGGGELLHPDVRGRGVRTGCTPSPPPRTASGSPSWTWRSGAWAI